MAGEHRYHTGKLKLFRQSSKRSSARGQDAPAGSEIRPDLVDINFRAARSSFSGTERTHLRGAVGQAVSATITRRGGSDASTACGGLPWRHLDSFPNH
jgi:hypothetical protein